jgi:hypothetical protein
LAAVASPSVAYWGHHVEPAVDYAKSFSRSHDAVIRVYDEAGNVIETHKHARRFQRVVSSCLVAEVIALLT